MNGGADGPTTVEYFGGGSTRSGGRGVRFSNLGWGSTMLAGIARLGKSILVMMFANEQVRSHDVHEINNIAMRNRQKAMISHLSVSGMPYHIF